MLSSTVFLPLSRSPLGGTDRDEFSSAQPAGKTNKTRFFDAFPGPNVKAWPNSPGAKKNDTCPNPRGQPPGVRGLVDNNYPKTHNSTRKTGGNARCTRYPGPSQQTKRPGQSLSEATKHRDACSGAELAMRVRLHSRPFFFIGERFLCTVYVFVCMRNGRTDKPAFL